jgi:Leucine-rich repeat (LRR) protein
MKKTIVCSLILFVMELSNFVLGVIPAEERAALIALYNSTNGDDWKSNIRWKTPPLHTDGFATPGTEGNWWGVTVSGDHVTKLHLENNDLIGSIPSELGNLSYLEELYMDNISEGDKTSGSPLGHQEELCIGGGGEMPGWNQLSGSIPPGLGNLRNLEKLSIANNQLSGGIPPQLGNLSNLQMLFLSNNQLGGGIPSEFGSLNNLEKLLLDSNQLGGVIPPELGNLGNLQYLSLLHNQLSGSIPPQLGNLSNLQHLRLSSNQLSGVIPGELRNLSNLEILWLNGNQLSGSIPKELSNLSNLKYLYMSDNQLSGNIPSELGNLNHLRELLLSENQLSGGIPKELSNLSNLEYLHMEGNQLSGSIPSELGNLNHLRELLLSENQLSGGIPSELGYLKDLYKLYLDKNHLVGSIPSQLGNLSKLNYLYLGMNQLSGDVPSSLMNLQYLFFLDIGYNCLSAADSTLRAWLNSHDRDWEISQCLEEAPPFGEFATPLNGSTVSGSIAITGWALDDRGMDGVKIYREQENTLIYIGDAIFIEGARPDVEIAYPGYPDNKKAGWGYMLLTNLLPNNGNGTFVIYTIAMDKFGKTTTLGAKTILADNASAVKPFGAIDTPTQGGTASGKGFINFGWALTSQPNSIPVNGSTINVVIDGVVKGHPGYNFFRSDVAALFPGYANSDGAGGGYYIDTTKLENGLHTIAWIVTDNAGNRDGIGSRYFTVQNSGTGDKAIKSFDQTFSKVWPPAGSFIEIQELERVEINLSDKGVFEGYLLVGDQLRELPIGSTLDRDNGIFYWQPGPGFLGTYRFMFIETDPGGNTTRKDIQVNITPKF